MRILPIALIACSLAKPALAQHAGHTMPMPETQQTSGAGSMPAADPHAGHDMGTGVGLGSSEPPKGPPPAAALSGPRHAADGVFDPSAMNEAREQLRAGLGEIRAYHVLIDRLETRLDDSGEGYLWDAQGWYGGDIDKLWIKTEGEGRFGEKIEDIEVQALWSHSVTPWFGVQTGVRYNFQPDPQRAYAVLGLQGLVPYLFEIDAAAFVSNEGDISARIEAEYEVLITQRLILQPRAEVNLAVQDVRELGIGSGLNNVELGLRLRYEFAREFAPYVGVSWGKRFGETANYARDEGESVDSLSFVAGVRFWF